MACRSERPKPLPEITPQMWDISETEARKRLATPAIFTATLTLKVADREQVNTYLLEHDAEDHTHAVLTTPKHRLEIYTHHNLMISQYDRDEFRKTTYDETWREQAFAALKDVLRLALAQAKLSDAVPVKYENRSAQKLTLQHAQWKGTLIIDEKTHVPLRLTAVGNFADRNIQYQGEWKNLGRVPTIKLPEYTKDLPIVRQKTMDPLDFFKP